MKYSIVPRAVIRLPGSVKTRGCDRMKTIRQVIVYFLLTLYALGMAILQSWLKKWSTYSYDLISGFIADIVMYLLFGMLLGLALVHFKISSWKTGVILAAINIVLYRILFFRLWQGTLPNLLLLLAGFELIQGFVNKKST